MQIAGESSAVEPAGSFGRRLDPAALLLNLRGKSPGRAALFRYAIFALLTVHIGLFLYFGYFTRILRPYSDLFDLIDFYFRFQESGNWLHYLLEPHNYHRLIWFRLLLALDLSLFKGSGLPFLVVALACHAAVAWLLIREIRRTPAQAMRLPAIAVILMLLLSTGVVVDLSVPANTPYVHTLFFAVLAIVLAEPLAGDSRRRTGVRRFLALLCVCGAAFSNAVGLVLWPVLACMAWRGGRADRGWLAQVLVVATVFTSAYLYGQGGEAEAAPLTLASLMKSADYFFTFMGLPWARASGGAGWTVGMVFFAAAAAALLRAVGPEAGRAERVALGLILFSLGAAALAALGRRDIAEAVIVPGRYSLLMTPLKLGLVMVALPWLERRWSAWPRAVEAGCMVLLAVLLLKQVAIGQVVADAGRHLRATITQFHEGARTAEMRLLIHPDLRRAESLCLQMRQRGLYDHAFLSSPGCAPAPAELQPTGL
jgi:hypothetical protein